MSFRNIAFLQALPGWWPTAPNVFGCVPGGLTDVLVPVVGRVYLVSFWAFRSITITRLSVVLQTTVAAQNIRLGVYSDGTTPNNPAGGKLLVDSGNLLQSGASNVTINFALPKALGLPAGIYWIALVASDAGINISRVDTDFTFIGDLAGETLLGAQFDLPSGFGSLPNVCPPVAVPTAFPARAMQDTFLALVRVSKIDE